MLNEAVSIIADRGRLRLFDQLGANVRYDGVYHPIRSLVQPADPQVQEIARVLAQAPDFLEAAQEFVNSFTSYRSEAGDYWRTPAETLAARNGDCDCLGILLCSILRNYMPADQVYCAFGMWDMGGLSTGHLWVVTGGEDGEDRVIEATAGPDRPTKGRYVLHGMFNDRYCFATDVGLREFDLRVQEVARAATRR